MFISGDNMTEISLLKKISTDLDFIKNKVSSIETDIEEINIELHGKVKPEYIKKLKAIDSEDVLADDLFMSELN